MTSIRTEQAAGVRAVIGRRAMLLLPALLMIGMGLWDISLGSALSNDESATMWAGRYLSLHQLLHLLGHVDAVHGLYYLFIHAWSRVVGGSPADLRIPSVLALAAAAAGLAALGRRLTGSPVVGLCAGLIMALTPSVSYYAQTARPYALVYLVVVLATMALLRALDAEPGAETVVRRWVLYAGLVTVVGWLNELALAVVVAHGVTLCWARVPRRTVRRWLVASLAGVLPVVPIVALSLGQAGQVTWLVVPDSNSAWQLFHTYFGTSAVIATMLLGLAVAGASAWRRAPDAEPAGTLTLPAVAVPLLVAPALVVAAASVVIRPLFDVRYVFYAEAGAALLAAAGVVALARRLRSPRVRAAVVAVVCVAVLVGQLADQQRQREPISRGGYGEIAAFVGTHAVPHDGLLFVSSYFRKIWLAYPGRFRKVTDVTLGVPPVQAGDFRGQALPFAQAKARLLAHRRVWTVGLWTSTDASTHPATDGTLALRVLRVRYHRVRAARFDDLAVCLWVRRSPPPPRA